MGTANVKLKFSVKNFFFRSHFDLTVITAEEEPVLRTCETCCAEEQSQVILSAVYIYLP